MMKAVLLQKYGSSDDLIFADVPTPWPKADEALVRLLYTSINAADLDYVNGHPLVRFTGLTKPGYPILGSDLVGVVEEIGPDVTDVQIGDTVWADTSNPLNYGTFAEYTALPASSLQKISREVDLAQAACLPSAGVVALQNVQLKNPAKAGDTALVNGAGGGIGNIIVQVLSQAGVEVTAVDKESKHEMLMEIGASHTIDYENTDYLKVGKQYDYVYDLVCYRSLPKATSILKKQGQFIMLGGSTANILRVLTTAPLLSKRLQKKIILGAYRTNDHNDLAQMYQLLKEGKIRPVIDRIIPFEEMIDGIKALEAGNVLGKIVIKFD